MMIDELAEIRMRAECPMPRDKDAVTQAIFDTAQADRRALLVHLDAITEKANRLEDCWLRYEHIQSDGNLGATLRDVTEANMRLEAEMVSRRDTIVRLWGEVTAGNNEYLSPERWNKIVLLVRTLFEKGSAEAASEIQAELNELRGLHSNRLERKNKLKDALYRAKKADRDLHKQVLGLVDRLTRAEADNVALLAAVKCPRCKETAWRMVERRDEAWGDVIHIHCGTCLLKLEARMPRRKETEQYEG